MMYISNIIQEYIETPKEELFGYHFKKDYFGLIDILKAADRRIGKGKLLALRKKTQSESARKVIEARFG